MEDLNLYLKDILTERPHTRVPSADTVLRGIEELATGQLTEGGEYDVDFDHQFLEAEKYDRNHGDGPVDPQIEGESKLGRNAEGVRLPNRNPFLFRKLLHFA